MHSARCRSTRPLRDRLPAPARAAVHAAGFIAVEYVSGRLFRLFLGHAPWDYARARWNLHGLIRADSVPLWAVAGPGLERVHDVLTRN